ncbi:MAG: hypothetical protein IT488_00285 [Gammaproteobacteria bacterium]|nr:hypothetical protein [Gammaproteobacteria bacterium]
MSRVTPGYLTGLLKIALAQSLPIAKYNSAIRQRLTDKTYFHNYTAIHADNEIPKDFFYKEVFRP